MKLEDEFGDIIKKARHGQKHTPWGLPYYKTPCAVGRFMVFEED